MLGMFVKEFAILRFMMPCSSMEQRNRAVGRLSAEWEQHDMQHYLGLQKQPFQFIGEDKGRQTMHNH